MNPVSFLSNNPNISFDSFKLAFQDLDPNKLKIIYDTVRNPSTDNQFNKKSNASTSTDNLLEKVKNVMVTATTGAAIIASIPAILRSQEIGTTFGDIREEMLGVNDAVNIFFNTQTMKFKSFGESFKSLIETAITGQVETYVKQQVGLLEEMNQHVGLTGQLSKDVREEITMANPELLRMGVGFKELVDFSSELVINTGKFTLHNRESLIEVGEISRAYIGTMSDFGRMLPDFEKIGYGMVDTARTLGKSGKESLSLGLRTQTVIEKVGDNVDKVNQFGFKNGVEGLTKMVQKSLEFRTNMDASFNVAEKVWDLNDSINLSAELQSLGGAVSDFMDPFKLSYMAVNNVEGIQDALIEMSRGLATYNNEQKRFEVTGVNLRLAREYAQKTGVDMKTLTEGAIAAAEKQKAHNDLLARGIVLNKEQERFITNISQMKNGEMTIDISSDQLRKQFGTNEILLKNLTEDQKNMILKYQTQFEDMNPKEIIRDQATIMQSIGRDVSFLAAVARVKGGRAVERAAAVTMYDMGFNKEFGDTIVKKGIKLVNDAGNLIQGSVKKTVEMVDGKHKVSKYLDQQYLNKREDEMRYGQTKKDNTVNNMTPEQYKDLMSKAMADGIKNNNHVNPPKTKGNVTYNYNSNNGRAITNIDSKK